MSYGSHPDEVAEDYRKALEDLTMNSRYEISNLTVIAKENTEHARAISEALKNHIKTTAPVKKLPALYVLDSVVKNVGTPYTLYFGRSLYSTFMEAYALVDNNVRRKMEEMLKTWKEPVPGSRDIHPVFPPEVTRPIENALLKARTSALEAQREYARSQPQQQFIRGRPNMVPVPYRNTPTPPGMIRQVPTYPPPVSEAGYGQAYPPNPVGQVYAEDPRKYGTPPVRYNFRGFDNGGDSSQVQPPNHQQYSVPQSAAPAWSQQTQTGYRAPDASIDTLTSDIANLIAASKVEFGQNPYDGSIQKRLKALLDLQSILQSQRLPPDQLALIRDQVAALSITAKPIPVPAPTPVVAPTSPNPPPAAQQPTLSSLLGGPEALAALLARSSATPQVPTPPPPSSAIPLIRSPPPQNTQSQFPSLSATAPATQNANPLSLLDKLRAAGMLPAVPASTSTPPVPPNIIPNLPPSIPQLPFGLPAASNVGRSPLSEIPNDVQLKPASLKIPRPHLISQLYERLGAPCTQCGRRFQSDEEGKKKKAAHMDWHFHVNKRMAEAEKRGQHRSWYVDELDWIKSRESQEDQLPNAANGALGAGGSDGASAAKGLKLQWLPVPDDPVLKNLPCPICQEKFETKWLDDAQEWVWMDAIKIGDRIYHASCHAEAKRDGRGTPAFGRGTPEPVLGKRKIEEDNLLTRTKIKTEPVI